MKMFKNIVLFFLLVMMTVSMSGCVITGSKGIDDLTEEEISDVVSSLEEAKTDLADELEDAPALRKFITDILDTVQDSFEDE